MRLALYEAGGCLRLLLPAPASVLFDAGGSAVAASQVVQTGPSNAPAAHHLYRVHQWRVVGKGALDSYPVGDSPDGEGGSGAAAPAANRRSLKCLEPLPITLLYADGDLNGISGPELLESWDLGEGTQRYLRP